MKSETFVIAPHPDDETIACAGMIMERIRQGRSVSVVLLTDGSKSHSACFGIEDDPTPERLAKIRAEEFRRVLALLGVDQKKVAALGFPDTALAQSTAQASEALQALLDGKDIAEIVYPSAYDMHRDHQAAHYIVNNTLSRMNICPRRICYTIWPEPDRKLPEPDFVMDIADHLDTKHKAMALYASQLERISPKQPEAVLPAAFLEPVLNCPVERFWTTPQATGAERKD
ncbi:PIG-L deacetylase family protein [Paucidesulfovibrio longus]|uniref:PIG-L deacetylase family protein n=1 Tax=Paucidesulfovibrio longus TaxID=889 RepID=UPI0003B495B6|nr:PIG-L deacetylase family protein [Paucidesulfovibrio longus]